MTPFNVADDATWPVILSAREVAAIYQRKVGGVKKGCQRHRFLPAPFLTRPWRWRKGDVLRHLGHSRGPWRKVA
jgi:hypothetical protein